MKPSFRQRLAEILTPPFEAAIAYLGHIFLGAVVMLGIWATGAFYKLLFPDHEPMLFDRIPVKWIFDAGKIATLVVFTVWGTIEAVNRLRHKP